MLRSALLTGNAWSDRLAESFSMHNSTLARHLKTYGLGLRQLVDECRFEVARDMLENSVVDVNHVAEMLDYADASAFTRAFRRWSALRPCPGPRGWRCSTREQAQSPVAFVLEAMTLGAAWRQRLHSVFAIKRLLDQQNMTACAGGFRQKPITSAA